MLCFKRTIGNKPPLEVDIHNSGAPTGAEGARGRSSIPIENGKSIKPRKFGGRPRPYVRTYARIRPGTSLSLSLIWSPSYAKSNTKHFLVCLELT